MNSRLRIIVTGLVGLYPLGGVAWDYLQYIVGLSRLGHEVFYHEDTRTWPFHPIKNTHSADGSYSAQFIRDFFGRYAPNLLGNWHYLNLKETSFGMGRAAFNEIAKTADLFINVSGACWIPNGLTPRCIKVFIDTDPGYNQIMLSERFGWSENVEGWCASVHEHDQHFTYAENIYGADCLIPQMGYKWKTTRMPVILDLWNEFLQKEVPPGTPWTTVITWNNFKGKLVYKGVEYKNKGTEFEKLIELPDHTNLNFKVALGNTPSGKWKLLSEQGWDVVDGPSVTLTPDRYQDYIVGSRGEISTAKHVYVAMRTGWFSCRSACYLASGRPVVIQDTGFSSVLPSGEGLMTFTTLEQAAEAIHAVEINYDRHRKAARAIAEEYFDSDKVLNRLIQEAGSGNDSMS